MEEKIVAVMDKIAEAGGMFEAARAGMVQQMIGVSAAKFQDQIDSGEQTWVGIKYQEEVEVPVASLQRPDRTLIEEHLETFSDLRKRFMIPSLNRWTISRVLQRMTRSIFAKIVGAASRCHQWRDLRPVAQDLGFGNPQLPHERIACEGAGTSGR